MGGPEDRKALCQAAPAGKKPRSHSRLPERPIAVEKYLTAVTSCAGYDHFKIPYPASKAYWVY